MANLIQRVLGILCLLFAGMATAACDFDRFECGLRNSEGITTCDEPGSVCICTTNRCAKPEPSCASTKFAYVRGRPFSDRCVGSEEFGSRLDQKGKTDAAALCETPQAECGVTRDDSVVSCDSPAVCDCEEKRCVTKSNTSTCTFTYSDRRGSQRDICYPGEPKLLKAGLLCPSEVPFQNGCGAGLECQGIEQCVCGSDGSPGRCAIPDLSCENEGVTAPYRHVFDGLDETGKCVRVSDGEEPEVVATSAACPGFQLEKPCGSGDSECGFDAVCSCQLKLCVRQDVRCDGSGYGTISSSGVYRRCIEEAAADLHLLSGANACPGDSQEGTCTGGESCRDGYCLCGSRRCASFDRMCGSHYRFAKDGRQEAGDCAEASAVAEAVNQDQQCSRFTPDAGVDAGSPDSGPQLTGCGRTGLDGGVASCPAPSQCLCLTGECARYDLSCAEEAPWRILASEQCASIPAATSRLPDTSSGGVCPGVDGPPPRCGDPRDPGVSCGDAYCLCGSQRCARFDSQCASGYRHVLDGLPGGDVCASVDDAEGALAPTADSASAPLCERFRVDAGSKSAVDASVADGGDQ